MEEEKLKNGFTSYLNDVLDADLTTTQKIVLLQIIRFYNKKLGYSFPSYEILADKSKITTRTAIKTVDFLVKNNWIKKEVYKGKGNKYFIPDKYMLVSSENNTYENNTYENNSLVGCNKFTSGVKNIHTTNTNINTNTITNSTMSDSKESDAPPGAFKDSINTNKKTKSSKKKTTKVFEENSIEYQLSEKFYRKVSEFNSSKYDEKPDLQKWSSEFEKLMRLDKVKSEDIETLIDWIFQEGNFWNDKVQTPAKFRKRDKEEVKYFNKIFKQMEKDPNYYRPSQKDLEKELPPITAEEFYDI